MEAFSKSDDERDFYLDKLEGFLLYVDIDKPIEELDLLQQEILQHQERYQIIPKMTFYETKKFMEGFVNEKVYDIDTKENQIEIEIAAGVKVKILKSYVTDLSHKKEEKKEVTKKTK
jgi:hypothetical protein